MTFVRVFSGTLTADSVWNSGKARDERITQLMFMRGKTQESTPRIGLGDIGVIPKLEKELEAAEGRREVDDLRRIVLEICGGRVARYDLTGANIAEREVG